MTLYTFYPRLRDGAALTFDAVELDGDQAAIDHSRLVLAEHPSAYQVMVWDGDRRVCRAERTRSTAPEGEAPEAHSA